MGKMWFLAFVVLVSIAFCVGSECNNCSVSNSVLDSCSNSNQECVQTDECPSGICVDVDSDSVKEVESNNHTDDVRSKYRLNQVSLSDMQGDALARRQQVRGEVRERVRDMRDEYKSEVSLLRAEAKDNRQEIASRVGDLLHEIENSNMTDEEKKEVRDELLSLRAKRVETRTEIKGKIVDVRAEYRGELRDFAFNLSLNRSRYRMGNGVEVNVRVMPQTAAARALERLRLRVCNESNNCSIELKEVGVGDKMRLRYSLQAKKSGRFLGLFKTKMDVESEVDSESGEVVRARKPWWAFLVNE